MPTTVRVPAAFTDLFDQAESYVQSHFDTLRRDPEKGTIRVGDERYVLVRAASLATGVLDVLRRRRRRRRGVPVLVPHGEGHRA